VGSHLLEFQSNIKPRIHTTAADSVDSLRVVEELRAGESSLIFDRVEQNASSLLGKIRKFQEEKNKPNGKTTTTKTEEKPGQREATKTQQNTQREKEKDRETDKDRPPTKHENENAKEKEKGGKDREKLNKSATTAVPFVSPNTVKKYQHINDTMHGTSRTIVEMKTMNKHSRYEQHQDRGEENEDERKENQDEQEGGSG